MGRGRGVRDLIYGALRKLELIYSALKIMNLIYLSIAVVAVQLVERLFLSTGSEHKGQYWIDHDFGLTVMQKVDWP